MKRQKFRKLLLIISLLLFPITIYYLSPVLIVQGALEGIINGSFAVFALMLVGSVLFGRLFCGYVCPAGSLQGCAAAVNDKPPKQGRRNNIKYIIWVVWIAGVIVSFIFHQNTIHLDVLYMTQYGISVADIYGYIIYYGVILLIYIPALIHGKRAFCHYFCWMAPFMVLGTKMGRLLHIPQLHIKAEKSACVSCKQCNKNCPMSLDVEQMVHSGRCESSECILCGACVDTCPKKALRYSFGGLSNDSKGKKV